MSSSHAHRPDRQIWRGKRLTTLTLMGFTPLVARFMDNGEQIELAEQDPSEWTDAFEKLTGGKVTQDGVLYTLTVRDVARTFTITGNERTGTTNSPR